MKIWIFGDSFAELREDREQSKTQWQGLIAHHFKCEIVNISNNGASAKWLTYKLAEMWNEIQLGDLVYVFVPYWDRQFILKEHPSFSGLPSLDLYKKDEGHTKEWNNYSKEQINAFRKYFMYLHDADIVMLDTLSLYAWINNLLAKTSIKPVVFDTRPEKPHKLMDANYELVKGHIIENSVNEFITDDIWKEMTKNGGFYDVRPCHLSKVNHQILAQKIIDYITNMTPIDLTHGFEEKFITKNPLTYL